MLEEYIGNRICEAYGLLQNDTEKAIAIFDDVLEIEPDNIYALNGKGSSLMKLNKLDEADQHFSQSLSIRENSTAILNKGIIRKRKGDFENALIFYDKALIINSNLEDIINILKKEIADAETNPYGFSDEANELINKGIEFKSNEKLLDAHDCLMKAIEVDKSCKDYASALINDMKTALHNEFVYSDDEYSTDTKIDRLKMQAIRAQMKENDPKKALELMDLVLKLNHDDKNILNHKGGILFICGEYENAIECFDKCLSIDRSYQCALFNKALVLRIMNKLPEALKCLDEVLKMPQNNNKEKAYRLEILEKLQKETKN